MEYYEDNADYDIEQMREDFRFIWIKNVVQVTLVREKNPDAGDYFREDEDNLLVKRRIWLNIQGTTSKMFKRWVAGVITPDSSLHAYALWEEDIQNLDVISFGGWRYRIRNYNESMYEGQNVFKEFDMYRVEHAGSNEGGTC